MPQKRLDRPDIVFRLKKMRGKTVAEGMGRNALREPGLARLLGDERFVKTVVEKHDGEIKKERRKKEHTLPRLTREIERQCGVSLDDLRSWRRTLNILTARRLLSILAKEYGYTGREIAAFLRKDPVAVTMYLRSNEDVRKEVEVVASALNKNA
jgi:chromosomal replication initiation ATPase DnaA